MIHTTVRRRLLVAGLLATIAAAAAGVAAPASLAYGCPPPAKSTVAFASFGDGASYVLASGGSFEVSSPAWSLSGGAVVQSGNESWQFGGAADSRSLYLPQGSSATSGTTCSPKLDPVLRFFARSTGSSTGRLHVELIVNGGSRNEDVLDGGTIAATSGWNVTAPLVLGWPGAKSGNVAFQVRLTPVGSRAGFVVDDVYIDPYQSR
jgi:hypothetical protein